MFLNLSVSLVLLQTQQICPWRARFRCSNKPGSAEQDFWTFITASVLEGNFKSKPGHFKSKPGHFKIKPGYFKIKPGPLRLVIM